MAATPTAVLAVGLGLVIEGGTTCPSPSDVAAALRPLLQEEISGGNDRLVLSQGPAGVVLELFDGHHALLGRRQLPPDVSCAAQARRVAVIAAAWQAELSEEPLPPAPGIQASPASPATRLWPPPTPPPARPNPLYLGTGLRLDYVPNAGVAAGFEIEAGAVWSRWGFAGGVWIDATRNLDETTTDQKFFRLGGELGPVLSVWHAPQIQLRVQALASGLLADRAYFDPGASVGVRLVPGTPPVRLFLDLSFTAWPRWFSGAPTLPMSWFEGCLALGLVLGGT